MKTRAAVLVDLGKPLVDAELEVPPLSDGQVLVEVAFSGVCHTQVLECRGRRGPDPFLPHCLGHEGSGVVVDAGRGVTKVKPGDRVILSWIKGRGADVPGVTYRWGSRSVNAGAVTTFLRHAVVSENRLTVLPSEIPMPEAALIGCCVPTGAGAVWTTARARAGQSIAVWGVGGIGLCAVAAAAVAKCRPIIAIDVLPDRLATASRMGATHTLLATNPEFKKEMQTLVPGGLDFVIEATGRPDVMGQAVECVRPRGGTVVIIGNAPRGDRVSIDPLQFNLGKNILGTWGGNSDPDRDYPEFCRQVHAKTLDVGPLISRRYSLGEINSAMDDLERGTVIRPIVEMSLN